MAKNLPFFRWFPADAETDHNYSALTDAELGFFHRCLNRSWTNGGLPADLPELARAMRVTDAYLAKVWVRVGRCFEPSSINPGMLINPRQEKERSHALSKSERATNSVRTRYERRTNELPRASESVSESVSVLPDARATPIDADDPVETVSRWLQTYNRTLGVDMGAPDAAVCFRVARAMISAGKTLDDLELILQGMIARKQKPGKSWGWHVTVLESQLGGTNAARA